MINLLLSIGAGAIVAIVITLSGFHVMAGVVPGSLVTLGLYVYLARRTFLQLQAAIQKVQAELSTLSPNKKEQQAKADKAIKMLEAALPLGRWQFLLEGEVHGQIGMIKYLFKDLEGALAAFSKTGPRNYFARAMQAAIFFQRKDLQGMERSFEDAVKHGKKEGLMWAAYAWCLLQNKESDKALKVLSRAVEANPSDDKLKAALTAVQNDKRLKMKAWEPMWWQLGLEQPAVPQPQFTQGRRPRFMRR